MNKKIILIILIVIIAIVGVSIYSLQPTNEPTGLVNGVMHDNGTLDEHQNIWKTSSNVEVTYGEDGTHFNGKNNESCWISLLSNNEQLFINPQKDFSIEMNMKSNNMMALYLIDSIDSNGNLYIVPTMGPNDFHHVKFDYSTSENKINYYVDNNLTKTLDYNLTGNLVGFKIIDWQGDMNIVINNVTVTNA